MRLYRTSNGAFAEDNGKFYLVSADNWDELLSSSDLHARVRTAIANQAELNFDHATVLAPVVSQEVWAAGVTYYRSRNARIDESKDAGGGSFYDRVYAAERPELFFKATGRRVVGTKSAVRIRSDSKWSVPEPELTLLINPSGTIVGYTIGNDMSSRDIEGENPLYLPQAKVYDGSCALGPCVLLSADPLSKTTAIHLDITRHGNTVFEGSTTLAELKRDPQELANFLFRDNSFPQGVFLMTGTGIVPANDFTLARQDTIRISIDGIGTLENEYAAEVGCRACATPGGGCQFLGTAATSQVVAEALGLSLPHAALAPSGQPIWLDAAARSARAMMRLVRLGVGTSQVVTDAAIRNAMVLHAAFGGSTNLLLHVPAVAHAAGLRRPSAADWLQSTGQYRDSWTHCRMGRTTTLPCKSFSQGVCLRSCCICGEQGCSTSACVPSRERRSIRTSIGGNKVNAVTC